MLDIYHSGAHRQITRANCPPVRNSSLKTNSANFSAAFSCCGFENEQIAPNAVAARLVANWKTPKSTPVALLS